MKFVFGVVLLGALYAPPALAQIYGGMSSVGSIVLSSESDETANVLLIAAQSPAPARRDVQAEKASAAIPAEYLPYILEAARACALPVELIHALILVESNYNPGAVSSRGAQGLMQLMPATARRFGIANSRDPRQNILAGSKYLRWLLDYFDEDLELSLAAYNAGEGAVVQAGRKIPNYLETAKYVPRVLSIYNRARPLS